MDIFFRRESEDDLKVAADAACFDGVDLITGSDGLLGIVAVHNNRHVCQQCGGGFIHGHKKLAMVPVTLYVGAPPMYLHAKCQVPPSRVFQSFKGLATRRRVANIVKQTSGLAAAAEANGRTIL